jgi:hypothetical protein
LVARDIRCGKRQRTISRGALSITIRHADTLPQLEKFREIIVTMR